MKHPPVVIILTGPPGAGKTTVYREYHDHLPCVDIDKYHGDTTQKKRKRKQELLHHLALNESFVFTTGANTAQNKEYWINYCTSHSTKGHRILLIAIMPPKMVVCQRMQRRPHHDRLQRGIEFWYRKYTTHTRELKLTSTDPRKHYGNLVHEHGAFECYRQWEQSRCAEVSPLLKKRGGQRLSSGV